MNTKSLPKPDEMVSEASHRRKICRNKARKRQERDNQMESAPPPASTIFPDSARTLSQPFPRPVFNDLLFPSLYLGFIIEFMNLCSPNEKKAFSLLALTGQINWREPRFRPYFEAEARSRSRTTKKNQDMVGFFLNLKEAEISTLPPVIAQAVCRVREDKISCSENLYQLFRLTNLCLGNGAVDLGTVIDLDCPVDEAGVEGLIRMYEEAFLPFRNHNNQAH